MDSGLATPSAPGLRRAPRNDGGSDQRSMDGLRSEEHVSTDFDLTGKVAVITGGNGGIGLGMAEALVRAGCAVSIWGRNAEKNASALAALQKLGKAEARVCDVTDRAAIEQAFGATLAAFGRVDGCFANAGIGGGGRHSFLD